MNVNISVFVSRVEAIKYLLIYNLHGCTFKYENIIFEFQPKNTQVRQF